MKWYEKKALRKTTKQHTNFHYNKYVLTDKNRKSISARILKN